MNGGRARWFSVCLALAMALTLFPSGPSTSSYAQGESRTFPETGKTVRAQFLAYWNGHGGLAQQGYPISEEIQEVSETDGKTYTVQYFERAVFELHTEFAGTPNEVLLSLLGNFTYKRKYPQGATGQIASSAADSHLFPETGKHVGGKFLAYWNGHGGLAQQGYPISEEFTEVSPLDSKPYTVQYFERAVFEQHPENQPPYDVLLSQLGTFRYKDKYQTPKPTPTVAVPTPTPPAAQPTATPASASDCSGIPASINQTVTPNCAIGGARFVFEAWGFNPGEAVGIYATEPDQSVYGAPFQETADDQGRITGITLDTDSRSPTGIWANTMEGTESHAKSVGYFKVIVPAGDTKTCSNIPASVNMMATPNCGPAGTRFQLEGWGFQPFENVGRYYTSPTGEVFPGRSQSIADENGRVTGITFVSAPGDALGIWAGTFEGVKSHRTAIAYFKVISP